MTGDTDNKIDNQVQLACPACGQSMLVDQEDQTRRLRCVACRHVFRGKDPEQPKSDPSGTRRPEPSGSPQKKSLHWKGQDLLPPRYRVSPEVEQQISGHSSPATASSSEDPSTSTGIDIDPQLLRVQVGDHSIRVRPLSLDDKARRKRIRVAIVYLAGLAILIGVFAWLAARMTKAPA